MQSNFTQIDDPSSRVAVISGSTGGIGFSICLKLAANGMKIVMLGRDATKLQRARTKLSELLGVESTVWIQVIDISDPESVERGVAEIYKLTPQVDFLVHAAGDGPVAPLLATTEAMWTETVQAKLLGTIRLTKAIAQHMVNAGGGHVVIVNGVFSLEPDPMFSINSTVNCGLSGFAKASARDLGRSGVRVNVVNPGATQTPLWNDIAQALAEQFHTSVEDIDAQVRAKIPLGKLATTDDIAEVVAFLASPAANYLNGTSITVDGGVTAAL